MSIEEYWMGKDIDLERLWKDFEEGQGYITKVSNSQLYLLRLTFSGPGANLPLFDHELIYKTVKGTFHDIKKDCFDQSRYNRAAPIFLRKIDRGSGVFEFLAQFDPLITWISALGGAIVILKNLQYKDQEYDEARLKFLLAHFPNASKEDISAYLKAWTTWGRRRVLQKLIQHGLKKVEISKSPLSPDPNAALPELINIGDLVSKN